ncbi:alkaline phosphatase family protein [Halosolutus gelatinilyticus]|uniref:alkaline phosphatase family protein n=1 Tax=Halosolutus gelatinilyticus TaxID=2931975 RepID=UPI001FF1EC6D|nr:alkaline phosphatase family protein [Halosolutus gelatinilyticus]
MNGNTAEKAFVLGIDGVPWNLLRKWSEAGELPNFGRLFREGATGPLESTFPPTTPLAWPSIATGTWADKHGIYGFHALEGAYTHRVYTGADRSRPALWDIMTPAVAGNVPMTYPADEIDGAMVSGMMTPERTEQFAHPSELHAEIEREIPDYRIGLDWSEYTDDPDRFVGDLDGLLAARRSLMHKLARENEWRLFFFVYTAPDRLQHLVWDEDVILDHYRQLDEIVGEAMTYAREEDATLYVVSDHGFGPISTFVNLNSLLASEGFLERKGADGARGSLASLGLTKSTVLDALDRVGITPDALVEHLPKGVVDSVAEQIPGDHGLYDVDFDETVAFAHDPSQIYVNDTERFDRGIVPPEQVESVKRDVAAALSDVTDPETGTRVLDVRDGDELFPTDPDSPDLIAVGRGEYEEKTSVADEPFEPAGDKAASHRSEGIFLAWGPTVDEGVSVEGASVVDVAPTVCHGAGVPVPEAADGRVLEAVFDSSSVGAVENRRYDAQSADTSNDPDDENFDGVEDRLRGLGYLE